MNTTPSKISQAERSTADLSLAFDVGHSSIGWAVLQTPDVARREISALPKVCAAGTVLFPSGDCLASEARRLRSARRNQRSARQRIQKLAQFFRLSGLLSAEEFDRRFPDPLERRAPFSGTPFPWLLATKVYRTGKSLSPAEFFDVLRWYAQHRGYDNEAPWWSQERDLEGSEDPEQTARRLKVAEGLMKKAGQQETMAETICFHLLSSEDGTCPSLEEIGQAPQLIRRFRHNEATFPRKVVVKEVRQLIAAHTPLIERAGLSVEDFTAALIDDWERIPAEYRGHPSDKKRLWYPKRYGLLQAGARQNGAKAHKRIYGGIIFGLLIPRFHNRIIGVCPVKYPRVFRQLRESNVSAEMAHREAKKVSKLPLKSCREFLLFRWSELLAQLRASCGENSEEVPLSKEERISLDNEMLARGYFSPDEIESRFRAIAPGKKLTNLRRMFDVTKERRESLVVDPVLAFAALNHDAQLLWPSVPAHLRGRLLNKLRRGKTLRWKDCRTAIESAGDAAAIEKFDAGLSFLAEKQTAKMAKGNRRKSKGESVTPAVILARILQPKWPTGRAPYHRDILKEARREILEGHDPRRKAHKPLAPEGQGEIKDRDGCLVAIEDTELMALGMPSDTRDAENDYFEWRERWLAKTNRKGSATNRLRYDRHGEEVARAVYKERQAERWLASKSNNHLVRQRLNILARVARELIDEFASEEPERVGSITIEVARDILTFSGMEDKVSAFNSMREQHVEVEKWMRQALQERGYEHLLTGSLLHKAKIADDLGRRCPYTGEPICPFDLALGVLDVDHIVPKSQRLTGAMEALVVTFRDINKLKGDQTAHDFIAAHSGEEIMVSTGTSSKRRVRLFTPEQFEAFRKELKLCRTKGQPNEAVGVKKADENSAEGTVSAANQGCYVPWKTLPNSDRLHPVYMRRRKRQRLLKVSGKATSVGFAQRDLTITSHLNRLAQAVLQREFKHLQPHHFISLPGSVTAVMRELPGGNALGCLSDPKVHGDLASRQVEVFDRETKQKLYDHDGRPLIKKVAAKKEDLRKLTHLHHAVDASVMGLAGCILPKDGTLWRLLALRDLTDEEKIALELKYRDLALRHHILPSLFVWKERTEQELVETGNQARRWRLVPRGAPQVRDAFRNFRDGLTAVLREHRVNQHIPAERAGLPLAETVYRVLTDLSGDDATAAAARAVLARKRELLADLQAEASSGERADKREILKRIEALQRDISEGENFSENVWIIHSVRVRKAAPVAKGNPLDGISPDGKKQLENAERYQAWLGRRPVPRKTKGAKGSVEDANSDSASPLKLPTSKRERRPDDPRFLRPFDPEKHAFMHFYEVKSRARVFGLEGKKRSPLGKLARIKAVKDLPENYAIAVLSRPITPAGAKPSGDDQFRLIRWRYVHRQIREIASINAGKMPPLIRKGSHLRFDAPGFDQDGLWRVVSIKDNWDGLAVDLLRPSYVKAENGKPYAWMNARLRDNWQSPPEVITRPRLTAATVPREDSTRIAS